MGRLYRTPSKRTISLLIFPFLILTLFLSACGKSTETQMNKTQSGDAASQTSSGTQNDTSKPIKFGFIGTLTGNAAKATETMKNAAELAVKHINAAGGINGRQVEVLVRDDKGKPEEAVKGARDMHNEGANLFFGVTSSAVALGLTAAVEEMDSILISTAAHSDKLTSTEFNKHYFRITDNAQMRNWAGAKIIAEKYPDVKNWATFSPDYEYGHNTSDRFFEALKKYQPEMKLAHESWPAFGAPDFKNFITAVQNAKPEGVFSSLYAGDALVMSQQAEPFKFYQGIKVFVNPSGEEDVLVELGKRGLIHEEWAGVHYLPEAFDNKLNKKFVEDYKNEYGERPTGYAAEVYNALFAYKAAIEKAKSTETKDVIAALEGLEYDSLTGKRKIRAEDHQAIKDVLWAHIKPSADRKKWEYMEFVKIPGEEVILPPNVKK